MNKENPNLPRFTQKDLERLLALLEKNGESLKSIKPMPLEEMKKLKRIDKRTEDFMNACYESALNFPGAEEAVDMLKFTRDMKNYKEQKELFELLSAFVARIEYVMQFYTSNTQRNNNTSLDTPPSDPETTEQT